MSEVAIPVETGEEEIKPEEETKKPLGEEEEPEEPEEVEITVGEKPQEEEEKEEAPQWVKDLRKSHREQGKKLRQLEKENEQLKKSKESKDDKELKLGPKPTLESCDYDQSDYEQKLDAWYETRKKSEEQKEKKEAALRSEEEAWNKKIEVYNEKKASLKVNDAEEAEEAAKEMLSTTQQGIIVMAANDPAKMIYAIGKYPDHFRELIETQDPIAFAYKAGRLETEVKTGKKAPKTAPEKTVSGSGGAPTNNKKSIERLEEDARKSGDYSKVYEYKRKLREAKKKE